MDKLVFNAQGLKQKVSGEKKQNQALFKRLEKLRPSVLDEKIHTLHEYYSEKIDCLECGNCCKSISPAMIDKDIVRIAKCLKRKPSVLAEKYMEIDKDGDYIFKSQPCPFLDEDNYCEVYNSRPRACREFPHTDRTHQQQILEITFKNISICPIVYEIVQELKSEFS